MLHAGHLASLFDGVFRYVLELRDEGWHVSLDDLPKRVVVQSEVSVRQNIAQARDAAPIDI